MIFEKLKKTFAADHLMHLTNLLIIVYRNVNVTLMYGQVIYGMGHL